MIAGARRLGLVVLVAPATCPSPSAASGDGTVACEPPYHVRCARTDAGDYLSQRDKFHLS